MGYKFKYTRENAKDNLFFLERRLIIISLRTRSGQQYTQWSALWQELRVRKANSKLGPGRFIYLAFKELEDLAKQVRQARSLPIFRTVACSHARLRSSSAPLCAATRCSQVFTSLGLDLESDDYSVYAVCTLPGGVQRPHYDGAFYTCRLVLPSVESCLSLHEGRAKDASTILSQAHRCGYLLSSQLGHGHMHRHGRRVAHSATCRQKALTIIVS